MEYALFAFAVLAMLVMTWLFCERDDLRSKLKYAEERAERWEKEARNLGWKNPFEAIIDLLKGADQALKKTVEVMRRTTETQNANTEKLKALNENLRETNENLRKQDEYLADARERLKQVAGKAKGAAGRLPPPPKRIAVGGSGKGARLTAYAPADPASEQLVQEAVRRAEKDAAAGKVETDPKKRN